MKIYRTTQFKIPPLTQHKLQGVEEARLRFSRAVDELIRRARENFDTLSFTYLAKDKQGNPILSKKTRKPVLRVRGAQFLAADLRTLMPASEIPLPSDIKGEVYSRVAMSFVSAWQLRELQKKGKINLSGGKAGLPRPKEYEGRDEKYLEVLRLMGDLPFIAFDSPIYETLIEYLSLHNALVTACQGKMDELLTDLPWGPTPPKDARKARAKRDRFRQKEITERLKSVFDMSLFVNLHSRLRRTARKSLAWSIIRFLQCCEADGKVTYEGEGEKRLLRFQDERLWNTFLEPLKVDFQKVDTEFLSLLEENISVLRREGKFLNLEYVSNIRVLSGAALLQIENVLRAEISRLLETDLLPLRSTKFRLYMHQGLNEKRVRSRKQRKETRPNKEKMVVEKVNHSLFIYFPLFPRGDKMCCPLKDRGKDCLVPLFGAGKVPRNGQGLLLPLRGGALQETWVKECEADLRKVKRLRDKKTGELKPRFQKLLSTKIEPKVAELIKKGDEYFLNLTFSLDAEEEIVPKTVMSVAFGLDNMATCTVVDLETGSILSEFAHAGMPHIEFVKSHDPRVAALQKQGVDLRDSGYSELFDEFTYRVVNSIIERARSVAAVIVVEDLTPDPTKTGPNRLLNRKRSIWSYGKFSTFLLDKAQQHGLPVRTTMIGKNLKASLFSVLSVVAHISCSECGETNVRKKKDKKECFIETKDDKMHCKKCGITLPQSVNVARVVASVGRKQFLEHKQKEEERRQKHEEESSK